MARISVKIRKPKRRPKESKFPLDSVSKKPRRGRPPKIVRPSEIRGRADNNRYILGQVWDRLWPLLSTAQREGDVQKALQDGANPYDRNFIGFESLILRILRDPKFPKRPTARVNFMADSLAGLDQITPRYSRDVCERDRANAKREHHIIKYEFWIECSCRFKGRSRNHACPKCGAAIELGLRSIFHSSLL